MRNLTFRAILMGEYVFGAIIQAQGKTKKKCPQDDIGVLLDMNALGKSV